MCYLVEVFFEVIILFLCSTQIYSISIHPLLLVVSFDGFRYNYFDKNLTPELIKLRSNGSYSEFMTSVFPTKTFPNHFSIGTGMYVDIHGVLDNKVYDSKLNEELHYSYDLFHYNKEIIPIWTLNERGGNDRHSGCMMWPGSDFEYQGTLPTFSQGYNGTTPWEEKVDTIISWFLDSDNPINLGMMYFDEPDLIVHSFGPDSSELNQQLKRVNSIVKYLMDKIVETELWGKLNVIFLSDHGGQPVPYTHVIDLNNYLNKSIYSKYGVSPNLQIYPQPGKYDEVLSLLRKGEEELGHFFVFTKDEINEQWHYKDNARCPPIFVMADVSYVFTDVFQYIDQKKDLDGKTDLTNMTFGTHGYDPSEENMRAFFMAIGPSIKRNHTIPPFVNIDLFPLFAKLLDLELPFIKPNGSLLFVEDIINVQVKSSSPIYMVAGILICALCLIVIASFIGVHFRRLEKLKQRKSSLSSYRVLSNCEEATHGFEGTKLLDTSELEDEPPS